MESVKNLNVNIVIALSGVGILIVVDVISAYFGVISLNHSLQILNLIVSAFLSGSLVYLYSQQTDIMDAQTELRRAELSGDFLINSHAVEDNEIEIRLSNLSSSEISNLEIKTELFPKKIEDMDIGVRGKPLRRRGDAETIHGRKAGLAPRELNVEFSGVPIIRYNNSNDRDKAAALTQFITDLRRQDVEQVKCRIWVEGTDQLGQTVKKRLYYPDLLLQIDTDAPPHDSPTLEEVIGTAAVANIDESKSEF
jgi:hypothetical protein